MVDSPVQLLKGHAVSLLPVDFHYGATQLGKVLLRGLTGHRGGPEGLQYKGLVHGRSSVWGEKKMWQLRWYYRSSTALA